MDGFYGIGSAIVFLKYHKSSNSVSQPVNEADKLDK